MREPHGIVGRLRRMSEPRTVRIRAFEPAHCLEKLEVERPLAERGFQCQRIGR
jgi:hypothetical protein